MITENFSGELDDYSGLIKCRVLPPTDLHIPVLPYRSNGKLMFPLCHSCADDLSQTPCTHTDNERAWDGTFVTHELRKARERGYRVLRVYEVWHWKSWATYDPNIKMGGLFTDYTKTFLKIKQESSGWPQNCDSEESKDAYIQDYWQQEGIILERHKIAKSPLRAVAKLLLNSLWVRIINYYTHTHTHAYTHTTVIQ